MVCEQLRRRSRPAGNRKLNKKRSSGRIDAMTALVMAFGVAPMRTAIGFDVQALIG
jgi:phage terminase large subunit-like protein